MFEGKKSNRPVGIVLSIFRLISPRGVSYFVGRGYCVYSTPNLGGAQFF